MPIPIPFRIQFLSFTLLTFPIQRLTSNLEDGLGQALHVASGDTGDGDTAVLGGVDGVLFDESRHLLGLQTGEGEHADLAGDVGPVVLAAQLLEFLAEQAMHLDEAVGHALELAEPLLVQNGVVHDGEGDAGAVDGRVGVEGADEDLDLRFDALLLLG